MTYDPRKHNRRSIRLKGHDYSSPGEYFLTLCVQNRICLFGEVEEGKMILNTAGRIMDEWWHKIPEKFPNAQLDIYQIMPNHFHAIVGITNPQNNVGEDLGTRPNENSDTETGENNSNKTVGVDLRVNPDKEDDHNQGGHAGPPQPGSPQREPDFEPRPASIPGIVQWFKTMTTNKYIQGVKAGEFPPFDRKLWQRNYYDHIIRDEKSLERIRNYITNNPAQWEDDRNNPTNI